MIIIIPKVIMRVFKVYINATNKDLYPPFCNDFFYREKTSNVPNTHIIEKAGVTMYISYTMWECPGIPLDGDAYITLFPKDAEMCVGMRLDIPKTVPLVCIGSSHIKYNHDMSEHSHVRIESSFPNLFEWLAGIFLQSSNRQSHDKVLEIRRSLAASITPEDLSSSIKLIEESLIQTIRELSDEENTLIAKYNTLTTNLRDDCGLARIHQEAYDKLCTSVYNQTGYTIYINRKGWFCIEHV